jgi:hypothetical protein
MSISRFLFIFTVVYWVDKISKIPTFKSKNKKPTYPPVLDDDNHDE